MSSITTSIQRDWANREIIEIVQLKILDIVHAVNHFDQSVRVKLSTFHEKLTKLERSLQICESSLDVSSTALNMLKKEEARQLIADREEEALQRQTEQLTFIEEDGSEEESQ